MTDLLQPMLLASLVAAHLDLNPDRLRFVPVQTGRHNRSFWVGSATERFVLRIAPPDDAGLLFYERLMMRQEPDIPVAEVVGYDFSRSRIDHD